MTSVKIGIESLINEHPAPTSTNAFNCDDISEYRELTVEVD